MKHFIYFVVNTFKKVFFPMYGEKPSQGDGNWWDVL